MRGVSYDGGPKRWGKKGKYLYFETVVIELGISWKREKKKGERGKSEARVNILMKN